VQLKLLAKTYWNEMTKICFVAGTDLHQLWRIDCQKRASAHAQTMKPTKR